MALPGTPVRRWASAGQTTHCAGIGRGNAMAAPIDRTTNRSAGTWARWLGVVAAAMLATAMVAAACSSGDDDADDGDAPAETIALASSQDEEAAFDADMGDATAPEEMMDAAEMLEMADDGMAEGPASNDSGRSALAAGVPAVPADVGRDIIYTAWVAVEAADVAAASAQANSIIEGLGGFIFSQDTRTQNRARTVLTFKVRPEQFAAALDRLSNVGELVEQTVNAEDVTGIVVDIASRIATAEVSVDRLREFLSQATEVEGVAELERELSNRETDLERLRGQLRSLRDQVDLATITLSITESVEAVPDASVILRAWMAYDDDPCLGFGDLAAPLDGDVGFCFDVENDGETTLTEVMLGSNALRFNIDDMMVSDGMSLERIEPGERAVATLTEPISDGRIAGRVATRGLEIDIRLSAVPVTADGAELARLARGATLHLYVEEEDAPLGFGDALSGGWNALVSLATGIGLVVVALLVWLPIIAVALWLAWRLLRRRRTRQPSRAALIPTTEQQADDD
ncbi:MAG: DUF4349 domain-containing protein [Acidimicrobiales bacterium]|nr:DUF4349 domain-containing protein [Acidimicrobiales bacterium]